MASLPYPVAIRLLADNERLIPAVGEIRWREWGHPPEPQNLAWWVGTTAREAGRDHLPVTWVAIDERGAALGAVGLGEFDIEERRDRSPWVLGMVVRPEYRGQGIGSRLIAALEAWAAAHGYPEAWVATGGRAIRFYEKCGWVQTESFERESGESATVLQKMM
jgi:GNAT superfamily N-acetyltransferase